MNSKDREVSSRIIHREYKDAQGIIRTEYKDAEGNIHTEYKDPQGNLHSYQNGYVDGHLAEKQTQELQVERTDKNISKGLLIGVILSIVGGLTAATIYFLTQQDNPQPLSVITVPSYQKNPTPTPSPEQVRIVEKPSVTIVPVPVVPQAQTPTTQNVTVQPPAVNSSPAQGGTSAGKPPKTSGASVPKPTTSVPKPIAASPDSTTTTTSTSSVSTADGDLKNEIVNQFENNLPDNQLIVDVKNGEVTVSGTTTTFEQLQQIQPLLNSIQGIERIDMKATVAP